MSNITERRLAITPGEATLGDENNQFAEIQLENGAVISFGRHDKMSGVFVMTRDEMLAEVHLGIDAHNTYNSCGMLPSEMLEKLREAKELILKATASDSFARMSPIAMSWVKAAEETLNLSKLSK